MHLQSEFTIRHVNIRREKAGEDQGPVAVDLRLGAKLSPDELTGLFATESSFNRILGELWNDEDELTTSDLDKITLARAGVGCCVQLIPGISGDKLQFDGADVNKIVLKPEAGRQVELSLRVQCKPTKEQIARLSEWLGCTINVGISQRQGELPLRSADGAAAPAPDAEEDAENPPHSGLLDGAGEQGAAAAPVVPGQKPPQRPKGAKTTH